MQLSSCCCFTRLGNSIDAATATQTFFAWYRYSLTLTGTRTKLYSRANTRLSDSNSEKQLVCLPLSNGAVVVHWRSGGPDRASCCAVGTTSCSALASPHTSHLSPVTSALTSQRSPLLLATRTHSGTRTPGHAHMV